MQIVGSALLRRSTSHDWDISGRAVAVKYDHQRDTFWVSTDCAELEPDMQQQVVPDGAITITKKSNRTSETFLFADVAKTTGGLKAAAAFHVDGG